MTGVSQEEAERLIRGSIARSVRAEVFDVDARDVAPSFVLLRGSVDDGRGVRMRTMVWARGAVASRSDGSEVRVSFRPHWEALAWMVFTASLALVGLIGLLVSLVSGSGPLLWPLGALLICGGFIAWRVEQLRSARRAIERDLLSSISP